MILQTKSETLAALLATEGGDRPHLDAVSQSIIIARALAEIPLSDQSVVNDRTMLKHQKRKLIP